VRSLVPVGSRCCRAQRQQQPVCAPARHLDRVRPASRRVGSGAIGRRWFGCALGAVAWLEHHHGGLGRAARGVGVEVLVDLSQARPKSLALGSVCGSRPDMSWSVACLDGGVRMSLQVEPPRGFGGTPTIHRHRDQVSAVLEVTDEHLSRPSRASAGRGELKRAPTVRLRPPQTEPGVRHAHQGAMGVPERHDEPARRQPGPATARARSPTVTGFGHDTIVTLSRATGQGRRTRGQRPEWRGLTPPSYAENHP
jgi:hypothetical protein